MKLSVKKLKAAGLTEDEVAFIKDRRETEEKVKKVEEMKADLIRIGGGLRDAQCFIHEIYTKGEAPKCKLVLKPVRERKEFTVSVKRWGKEAEYKFKNYAEACKHFGLKGYRSDGFTARQELERRGFLVKPL